MRMTGLRSALCAAAAFSLAACDSVGHKPGPAELALVTAQLDTELNDAPQRLQLSLVNADRDHRVHAPEIVVAGNGWTIPADWWVYRQGWLRFAGIDEYSYGYFTLTPAGRAFVDGPRPVWLKSSFKQPPQVDCAGGGSWTSCKVTGTAVVGETPEGQKLLGPASLPEFALQAELDFGPEGWDVKQFQIASGGQPTELSRTTMLGDRDHIYKAHWKFAVEANRLVG